MTPMIQTYIFGLLCLFVTTAWAQDGCLDSTDATITMPNTGTCLTNSEGTVLSSSAFTFNDCEQAVAVGAFPAVWFRLTIAADGQACLVNATLSNQFICGFLSAHAGCSDNTNKCFLCSLHTCISPIRGRDTTRHNTRKSREPLHLPKSSPQQHDWQEGK